MSQERRQWFGAYLARLRRTSRLSQRQVASKLCALSGVQSLTRNEVSRWERGERIPDSWLPALAQALEVPLNELEQAAAYAREEIDGRPAEPTTIPVPSPAHPAQPVHRDMRSDRTAMDSFRMADRQLGGGHLYGSVMHYLNSQVAPRIFGADSVNSAPETFLAAAALTEMAGWMAHDSGQDNRARQHFEHALPLARAGSDHSLTAHVFASLSHLALQSEQPRDAIDLARSGRAAAKAGPLVPMLSARLYAMQARASARLGEESASRQALAAAEDALGREAEGNASEWISQFDAASLASEETLCLQELGQLPAAAEAAERAVSLRTGERARSRVFSQISLAAIRAEMGELDAACTVASELLESCRTLGSLRITHQLDDLAQTLRAFQAERSVAELLDSLTMVNQQRSLLLAGITPSHSGGIAP
ncbi:helix-turn-helix transcriptional regulator [Streptomyces sp. B6B3]|uniref:helix-turn-helix domain-containing protein n=1 Tax=Streptomyces sp. B6B3 TaxID=3153570 RepID=UPI00325F10FE